MNLLTGIIAERDRVRDLLKEYEKLGPIGAFGSIMLKDAIRQADEAIEEGDVVKMVTALKALKECE